MSPENNQLLATWMLVYLRLAGSTKNDQRTKIMCIIDTRDQKTESLRSRRTFELSVANQNQHGHDYQSNEEENISGSS